MSYRQELADAARSRIPKGRKFTHEVLSMAPADMDIDTLLLLMADALDPMVPRLRTTTANAQVNTNVAMPNAASYPGSAVSGETGNPQ